MEEIKQEIQDDTSNYLFNIPTPNENLRDTTDEITNYIYASPQDHHSYTLPMNTPIIHIYSIAAQEHLTTDIISEARTATA